MIIIKTSQQIKRRYNANNASSANSGRSGNSGDSGFIEDIAIKTTWYFLFIPVYTTFTIRF